MTKGKKKDIRIKKHKDKMKKRYKKKDKLKGFKIRGKQKNSDKLIKIKE
jgi:hypothetical protein